MNPIQVKKLRENAVIPSYGTAQAAGADLYACIEKDISIEPGATAFVSTGISMALPEGTVGLIYARSGLACKQGLAPANKVGVIDSDYRGELIVALHNHGNEARVVCSGDRVAQLVIAPVFTPGFVLVSELDETIRGSGGFGSTGK